MLRVVNPATRETLEEIEEDSGPSLRVEVEEAWKAQSLWAKTPLVERKKIVAKFSELLLRDRDDLARTLTSEMGKPIRQSRAEIEATPARIQFFLDHVDEILKDEIVFQKPGEWEERISQEPLGVIANISAWNYPYFVGTNVFIPALLTGNAVLYKPSEIATLTGLSIEELFLEAGLPEGVFSTIIGAGTVGRALLEERIAGVYFTGSVPIGMQIAESASRRMLRVQLELGGKDPVYVCDDVDAAAVAAATADGAFYNTGQSCCAVERLYVHEKIYEPFLQAFLGTVKGFVVGDPLDEKTYIGPLARPQQIDLLEDQVRDAVAKGAKILCGGKRDKSRAGFYFEPTVLSEVSNDMKVMREESFGPVIGIMKVASDAQAVTVMNDSDYGLTASIYTRDRERAETLLGQMHAGSVYWNCCDRVSPRLPWTGRKHSGLGATLSLEGIRTFVQPKAWHLKMK